MNQGQGPPVYIGGGEEEEVSAYEEEGKMGEEENTTEGRSDANEESATENPSEVSSSLLVHVGPNDIIYVNYRASQYYGTVGLVKRTTEQFLVGKKLNGDGGDFKVKRESVILYESDDVPFWLKTDAAKARYGERIAGAYLGLARMIEPFAEMVGRVTKKKRNNTPDDWKEMINEYFWRRVDIYHASDEASEASELDEISEDSTDH